MSRFSIPAVAVSIMLVSTSALGHAELQTTTPAADATVQTALPEIALEFTEDVEPMFSTIEVKDDKGARLDNGDVHVAPGNAKRLMVSLKALQPGTYTVIWRITSTDTHKISGNFDFKVAQ